MEKPFTKCFHLCDDPSIIEQYSQSVEGGTEAVSRPLFPPFISLLSNGNTPDAVCTRRISVFPGKYMDALILNCPSHKNAIFSWKTFTVFSDRKTF